jgi:hypothetical protein
MAFSPEGLALGIMFPANTGLRPLSFANHGDFIAAVSGEGVKVIA